MNRKPWAGRFRALAALLLLGLITALFGFQYAFPRRGEAALARVPGDALGAVVLDFQPSWKQLMVFRRLAGKFDQPRIGEALRANFGWEPWQAELASCMHRSGVVAMLPSGESGASGDVVGWFAVADEPKARSLIAAHATERDGAYLGRMGAGESWAAFADGYLVVTTREASLRKALGTREADSLLRQPDYRAARARLEPDANLIVVGRDPTAKDKGGFFGFGAALRDEGLSVTGSWPVDPAKSPAFAQMAAIPAPPRDFPARLPEGAAGVLAVSRPGEFWEAAKKLAADLGSDDGLEGLDESLQRDFGIGEADLVSAGGGTLVAGGFPASGGEPSMLLVLDDAGGAKPGALADRITPGLERQLNEDAQHRSRLESLDRDGATLRVLRTDPGPTPQGVSVSAPTMAYAAVDDRLLASTSQSLLERGIDVQHGRAPRLDPKGPMGASPEAELADAQVVLRLDLAQAVAGLKPEEWAGSEHRSRIDLLVEGAKRMERPLSLSVAFRESSIAARAFIPIDFDTLDKLIEAGPSPVTAARPDLAPPASDEELTRAKQVALATVMYTGDYDDRFPPAPDFDGIRNATVPYATNMEIYDPGNGAAFEWEPRLNARTRAELSAPSQTPMFWSNRLTPERQRTTAFADGTARRIPNEEFERLRSADPFGIDSMKPAEPVARPPDVGGI